MATFYYTSLLLIIVVSTSKSLTVLPGDLKANGHHEQPVIRHVNTPNGEPSSYDKLPEKILTVDAGPGPLGYEILKTHPRLSFVGEINGKNYYIERTQLEWVEGQYICNVLGMHLGRFDNIAEQDFVYARLPSSDDTVWTGALTSYGRGYWPTFYWDGSSTTVSRPTGSWSYYSGSNNGLTLDANNNNLLITPEWYQRYFLCYL